MRQRARWMLAAVVAACGAACFPTFDFSSATPGDGGPDATTDAPPDGSDSGDARASGDVESPPLAKRPLVGTGYLHTCVVSSGRPLCWGAKGGAQLGRGGDAGAMPEAAAPGVVRDEDGGAQLSGVTAIGAGEMFTCALANRRVYCWGDNGLGQLGTSNNEAHALPVRVQPEPAMGDVDQLAVGWYNSCAIVPNGDVHCWGLTDGASLTTDVPSSDNALSATPVESLRGAKRIALGREFGCIIRPDETVACWGRNDFHQAGQATSESCFSNYYDRDIPCVKKPTQVQGLSRIVDITAAFFHACAVDRDGRVFCWGRDRHGDLGAQMPADAGACTELDASPPGACTATPRLVMNGGAQVVSSGFNYSGSTSCASTADAGVFCWGHNGLGQLAQGALGSDSARHPVPLPIFDTKLEKLPGVIDVGTGYGHSCALTTDGRVFCWGSNTDQAGPLGAPDTANRAVPVPL